MSVPKIVVHTDVLLEHLTTKNSHSVLRLAMGRFFCYTTAYQAIELFAMAKSEEEKNIVEDSMAAMKVLGLNPKNARKYGELMASNKKADRWNILIAGLCIESRLPLLTDRRKDFKGIRGLVVVPTKLIAEGKSGQEILRTVQR
ncbi:MAG: hypothetical protein KF749_14050 [Bacteroidetes bacterium]|nr:hypothetical protein [Bacteroidota bacterium]MCW5895240.1 hypothetical protein [Bacteroidota bacterium]